MHRQTSDTTHPTVPKSGSRPWLTAPLAATQAQPASPHSQLGNREPMHVSEHAVPAKPCAIDTAGATRYSLGRGAGDVAAVARARVADHTVPDSPSLVYEPCTTGPGRIGGHLPLAPRPPVVENGVLTFHSECPDEVRCGSPLGVGRDSR